MKSFIFLGLCLTAVTALPLDNAIDKTPTDEEDLFDECIQNYFDGSTTLKKLLNDDDRGTYLNHQGGCLFYCSMKSSRWLQEDGTFDNTVAKLYADEEMVFNKVVADCKLEKSDNCDFADCISMRANSTLVTAFARYSSNGERQK